MAVGAVWSLTAITGANSRYNTRKAFTGANLFGFSATLVTFILLFLFGESGLDREYRYLSSIAQSRTSVAIAIGIVVLVYLASFPREESDFSRAFLMTHKAFFVASLYGIVLMMGTSGVAGAIQALLSREHARSDTAEGHGVSTGSMVRRMPVERNRLQEGQTRSRIWRQRWMA